MTSRDICKLSSSRDSFNSLNLDAFKVFFFFLIGLIAGAKPSSTVLNRSVQGAHSCLIPDVKKIFQILTIEYDASCGHSHETAKAQEQPNQT